MAHPNIRSRVDVRFSFADVACRCCAWLGLFVSLGCGAGGLPLMQRFTNAETASNPNYFAVVSGEAGSVHVGNIDGLLEYRGGRWSLSELPGRSPVRALILGSDGGLYVGGYDQFGVFRRNATGALDYEDLRPRFGLTGEDLDVGDVWTVFETPQGLYFRAAARLFHLRRDGSARSWPLPDETRSFYPVGDVLYARVNGLGVVRFVDGEFQLLPGGEAFADQALVLVSAQEEDLLLVGSRGFFLADRKGVHALPTVVDEAFREHEPYYATILSDDSIVVGTLDGELMRFSPALSLLNRLRLRPGSITGVAQDAEGGLWVSTEFEVLRLKLPSAWSVYSDRHGIVGTPADVAWHEGALWLATTYGMAVERIDSGASRFELRDWTELEVFDLAASSYGLLIAERNGVLALDLGATTPRRVLEASAIYLADVWSERPDRAWALGELEFFVLHVSDGRWHMLQRIPLEGLNPDVVLQAQPGEFWFGNLRGEPQRWHIDPETGTVTSRETLGDALGLRREPDQGTALKMYDGQLWAVSGEQVQRWTGDRWAPADMGPFAQLGPPMNISIRSTPIGVFAWSAKTLLFRPLGAVAWKAQLADLGPHPGFLNVDYAADGKLRVVTSTDVLEFDPTVPPSVGAEYRVALWALASRDASGHETRRRLADPAEFPPGGMLRFDFGINTADPGSETRFRLEGAGDAWSEWAGAGGPALALPNPGHGDYRLRVEGRVPSGAPVTPLVVPFHVMPRWYETGWARAASLAAVIGLVWLIARLASRVRARRLIAANRRLQQEVWKRTEELENANLELARSNEELATSRAAVVEGSRRADLIFRALNEALVGVVLDDHYRLDERIGSGGFGTVYAATQLQLNNRVAIKVFKPVPGHDPERAMDRFRTEGLSAFRVNHPHAVRVLDFCVSLEAVAYLVMEYLQGESLGEHLARHRTLGSAEAIALLKPLCEVLEHAHSVGVIHRDVKPSNIILATDGEEITVKLIDFGIAKVMDGVTPTELKNLTATGLLMGTPNYMAPERFFDRPYDGRSDVYSLGVVAFEVLAGRRPFRDAGENYVPLAYERLNEDAPSLLDVAPEVGAELARLVDRMLSRVPSMRPTAEEAARALARMTEKTGSETVAPGESHALGAGRVEGTTQVISK